MLDNGTIFLKDIFNVSDVTKSTMSSTLYWQYDVCLCLSEIDYKIQNKQHIKKYHTRWSEKPLVIRITKCSYLSCWQIFMLDYMFTRYFRYHFSAEEQVAQNIDQSIIGLSSIYNVFWLCLFPIARLTLTYHRSVNVPRNNNMAIHVMIIYRIIVNTA